MSSYVNPVGRSMPRLETRDKITGRAMYTDDMKLPGMLHAAVLQSPYAHARILSYDVSRALAVPGVAGILTGDDIGEHRTGPFVRDETAIAKGKVRYMGEPVAAVAATDPEIAQRAVLLVDVTYEELPAVLDVEAALAGDAPVLHENFDSYVKTFQSDSSVSHPNLMSMTRVSDGDVEAAWQKCDVIVEGDYLTQAQCHAYMEPCSALADVDANGKITIWSGNQSVFHVQANVAHVLGMPMSKIRCVTPRVGGAFGGKMEQTVQPIVAALARKTGRPVKLTLSREQDFEMIRSRHPAKIRIRTGAMRDGTLVVRDVRVILDAGAYADDSPGVAGICALFGRGPYHIENVFLDSRAVYTNKLRAGAFRGFGGPQVAMAGETQIDEIAAELDMDPLELRLKNAVRPGDEWMSGLALTKAGLSACLERVREESDWSTRRKVTVGPDGTKRSIGVACLPHISGLLTSGAIVRILEDGTAVLNTGAVDNGQGSDTVLVQMCAGALGLDVDSISLATPDTDGSPYNWGTTASRVTYMTGRSVVAASESAVEQLKQRASAMLECAVEDLEMRQGGFVGITGVPDAQVSYADISAFSHWVSGGPVIGSDTLAYDGEAFDPKRGYIKGFTFGRIGAWIFAAQAVEVQIDEATGTITPLRVWSAHDIGKAINPSAVEGQIEGGVVQGIGYALYEEMVWDSGRLANPSFMDYKIPGTCDAPPEIHSILIEDPDDTGPFGAKGVGEPPIVGIAPAIANAVAHACGIGLKQLPMTPESVLRALKERP